MKPAAATLTRLGLAAVLGWSALSTSAQSTSEQSTSAQSTSALSTPALGTPAPGTPAPGTPAPAPATCPGPDLVRAAHFYGLWRAQFDGQAGHATLLFEASAEHPDGLRGLIRREEGQALLAGDVQAGEFSLEESDDGVRITATWQGRVSPDRCGQEIRGQWQRAGEVGPGLGFVLRKQVG